MKKSLRTVALATILVGLLASCNLFNSLTNEPPVADAGSDIASAPVGDEISLDGSASTGDITQYTWSIVAKPSGSPVTIFNSSKALASITPDRQGTYVIQLDVQGSAGSSSAKITIIVDASLPKSAALTAFSFANPAVTAVISGTSITASLPFYAPETLAATFTTASSSDVVKVGTVVQVSGTTTNDFTQPVTVTVTNGSKTRTYTVTATSLAPVQSTLYSSVGQTGFSSYPWGISVDSAGNRYVSDAAEWKVYKIDSAGGKSVLIDYAVGSNNLFIATKLGPMGLALDDVNHKLYVAVSDAKTISVIDLGTWNPSTSTAGTITPTGTYTVNSIRGLAYSAGKLYVGDGAFGAAGEGDVYEVNPASSVSSKLVGLGATTFQIVADGSGYLYCAVYGSNSIEKVKISNGSHVSLSITGLSQPQSVGLDSFGNLYTANGGVAPNKMFKVTATGSVTTLLANGPDSRGLAFFNGKLYSSNMQNDSRGIFTFE